MKKLFIILILAGLALLGAAQDQDSMALKRKNVLKFLPVNLLFQSTSFEFERMINGKNSFTLGIGLPNQKSMLGKFGIKEGSDPKIEKLELGTMHVRVAYRHYGGQRRLPNGFYIEPYLKYQDIKGNSMISGIDNNNLPYSGTLDVKLNTMNLGFQLGAQFLIAKRIAVDFYFLGLEAGFLSGDITANSTKITDANNIKGDIDNAIADLPSFIGKKLTVTQTGNQVNINAASVPYPWFRSGISIGIAF